MLERNSSKKRPLLWMQVLTITITLIAVALAILFSSQVHSETREMATEQFNQQQLILAHSAAAGIEAYYQELSGALSALAQLPCIQQITPECLKEMQHTYDGFPLRTSIRLLDSNGVLRFIYPFEGWRGELIGGDYSGEAYFQQARETGRISVSGLVINEQGDARIRVAVPLYLTHETERVQVGGEIGDIVTPIDPSRPGAGEFQGVLIGSIDPRIIDQNFISPVVSGETGYAWLLNENGVFVAHHNEEFIGRNAFEVQAERNTGDSYQAIEQIQRRMIAGEEGTSRYVSNWHQGERDEIEELIAYAPAHIGEHVWSVAVCAPVSEVEQVIQFAKRAEQYTLALVILSLAVGGLSLFTTSYRWSRSLEQEAARRTKELRETIAERKQAEEALRESELRYRTTLDSMGDAIHLVGPDLRLTLINPTYKQIFGDPVSDTTDIIGRTVFEASPSMPEGIRDRVRDEYDRVFRTGETLVTEESFMLGDKETIIETRKIPIFEQGKVTQVVTVMRDVTERVRADKALQESKQRYQSIFDGVQDAIFVESASGEILDANARACEMFGYSHDEFLTKTVADLVPPEHFALIPDTLPGSRIPHRPIETVNIRASGEHFPVEITGQLQTIGGETVLLAVVRDITERKQVEETLRESEQEYRTMIEQSNDMIWTLDTEANFTFFNKRSEELSGYHLDDWRGKSFAPLVAEEDLPLVTDTFHRTLNGEPQHYEVRVKKPDGNTLILSVNTAPILKAGQVVGTVSFGRDITEHKQVEEALWESELRYRTTLNSMADAIHLVGPDLRFTLVNPAHQQWVREFGSDTPNYIGQTIFDVFPSLPDEFRDKMRDEYDQVFRTSKTLVTEESTTFEDRELVTETRKIPVFERGEVTQVITIMRDITERNQARREIETRRSYLENVLTCAPDAIVTLDDQQNILEWNQGAERLFGYTSQEAVGQNLDRLISVPDTNVFEEATSWTQQALAGRDIPPTETIRYRKDGSPLDVITSGSPILVEGKVSGVVAIYTDITERKRIEEQLRQQERLAAVGQLAGGIAHDFNNLLTTIMLYAQMALRQHDLSPNTVRAFETILGESRRAADLVQQILDFSRHAMLKMQTVDLGLFTKEVINVLRRTIPENIHLTLEVIPEECVIEADPTRIQQVLMNLATNARDAMPEGGALRFGLSRVKVGPGEAPPVTEMGPGDWVCLTASDTGMGIAKEVRSHLFEPFFTTKEPGKGTGLGLAQVHGIVRQHEGYIGVETEIGRGTTFRIYFPASETEKEIKEEKVVDLPQGQGETVLLVEDREELRKAGQEILELLGYQVLAGADGCEALEMYRSAEEVDLVITDLVMPEMGGRELARELRKINPALKVVAITGYIIEENVQELKEAGFLDVVYKPFKMDTLAQMVRRALDEG